MRKYIRKMLKYDAENKDVKGSKWVHKRFENLQIKKYGKERRNAHKAISTHKRRIWKSRIELFT